MQTGPDEPQPIPEPSLPDGRAVAVAGTAEPQGLTPESVLKDFDALLKMPAGAYVQQLPQFLQLAEEAVDTFQEPAETNAALAQAYKTAADQFGAWLDLQSRHSDLLTQLEGIEATLKGGGSVDPAGLAGLEKIAAEANPVVPAPHRPPVGWRTCGAAACCGSRRRAGVRADIGHGPGRPGRPGCTRPGARGANG